MNKSFFIFMILASPAIAQDLPYPDAVAPWPMPAVAPSEDSDCAGMISLPTGWPRMGTWAVGEIVGRVFTPFLYFNTRQDAQDCAGSSELKIRKLTRTGWKVGR